MDELSFLKTINAEIGNVYALIDERMYTDRTYVVNKRTVKSKDVLEIVNELIDKYDNYINEDNEQYALTDLIPDQFRYQYEPFRYTYLKMKQFRKDLLSKFDTIPYAVYITIYKHLHKEKKALYQYIQTNLNVINRIREMYIHIKMIYARKTPQEIMEETKSLLLDIAQVKRKQLLTWPQFRLEIALKFKHLPLLMTWNEMYTFYKRNVKHSQNIPDAPDKMTSDQLRNYYGTRDTWNKPLIDSFNWKKQRKLMKHFYGPRYTFMIDYMFCGRFVYLLAINVNTRKAFLSVPQEIYQYGHNWQTKANKKEWKVNGSSIVKSLNDIMQNTPIKYIYADNEFNIKEVHDWMKNNDVQAKFVHKNNVSSIIETNDDSRSIHSTTCLVDRLMRTIRLMNYQLGNRSEITPPMMEFLIQEYNNSPHSTFYKIFKVQMSPNEVDSDIRLENEVVKYFARENFCVEMSSPDIKNSKTLRVYNQADLMDKVKPKLLPGYFEYVGMKNGLVEVKQGDNKLLVNRWMIKS